jgi:beta-fructofuranosidase
VQHGRQGCLPHSPSFDYYAVNTYMKNVHENDHDHGIEVQRKNSYKSMRFVLARLAFYFIMCSVASASQSLIAEFEQPDFSNWQVTGDAFGNAPGRELTQDEQPVSGYIGMGYLHSNHGGREARGTITSPPFRIEQNYINFLIAGGHLPGDRSKPHPRELWGDECLITLLVDADINILRHENRLGVDDRMVLRWSPGNGLDSLGPVGLEWGSWDVRTMMGRRAWIRIVDNNSGPEGAIFIDQIHQDNMSAKDLLSNPDGIARAEGWVEQVAKHTQRKGYHYGAPALGIGGHSLLYHKGWYHLFYIHKPHGRAKGGRNDAQPRSHFRHARTRDLVYWEDLPTVIWPSLESGEFTISSGGAVIADNGTPMFFYTSRSSERAFEQWAAVGDSSLVNWRKLSSNPMVKNHPENPMAYGTDPFLLKEGSFWYMGLGGYRMVDESKQGCFSLYQSVDLVHWKYTGIPWTTVSQSWEEPDFYRLGDDRWALIFEPWGPSRYATGTYDPVKHEFTAQYHGFLDYAGAANYNAVNHRMEHFTGHFIVCDSTLDDRGRRICVGLAPMQLSLPRVLTMRPDGRVGQKPIPELVKLRRDHHEQSGFVLDDEAQRFDHILSKQLEIKIEFEPDSAVEFGLKVRCSEDGSRFVKISCDGQFLEVEGDKTPARLMEGEETLRLHLFLDDQSLEIFANDWVVYTEKMSVPETDQGVEVFSDGGNVTVNKLDIWNLASIW